MKSILGLVLAVLTLAAGLAQAQEIPAGGRSVLPRAEFGGFSMGSPHPFGTTENVVVTGMPFSKALRTKGNPGSKDPWNFQLGVASAVSVNKGDVLLASFYLRCIRTVAESGSGRTVFVFQRNGPPWTDVVHQAASAGQEWQHFFIPFESTEDFKAGTALMAFRLGYEPQTLEFGGIEVVNYGKSRKVSELLVTQVTYRGMEADAPWRQAAEERIKALRTGELTLKVVDGSGKGVSGAKVEVQQSRSAFLWGTAVQEKLLGPEVAAEGSDLAKYRETVKTWFNMAVLENALKAQPLNGDWGKDWDWDVAVQGVDWLRKNGLAVRGHVLVWPSWRNAPKVWRSYEKDPKKLKAAILAHIAKTAGGMAGKLKQWDVVNEPYDNVDITNILGEDSLVEWYQAAQKADPNAQLFLNDYSILAGGAGDTGHRQHYEKTVEILLGEGAPLQGLGMQGHFGAGLTDPMELNKLLDRYAKFNLPIMVTEYDILIADEQLAGAYTRDFLTMLYSHPAVQGVMLWGFWDGAHPSANAPLLRKDWTLKPAGEAWKDLVLRKWRTHAALDSDAAGAIKVQGHLGEYTVVARKGNLEARGVATLGKAGATLTLKLVKAAPTAEVKPVAAATPVASKTGLVVFEDFEGRALVSNSTFGDVGSKVTLALSDQRAHAGKKSAALTVTTAGWGGGFSLGTKSGLLNVEGKKNIELWMWSDKSVDFSIRFREGTDDGDVNDENWRSGFLKSAGDGVWTRVLVPLAAFSEDPYGSKPCHGHCDIGPNGNNKMDLNGIGSFQMQFSPGASGANVFVDDIRFVD